MSEESDYELVMPFVTVASKGGPHEDAAYCCGWEMGALDCELEGVSPPKYARTVITKAIHAENVKQAELIAMKYGFTMEVEPDCAEEWCLINLRRADDADAVQW